MNRQRKWTKNEKQHGPKLPAFVISTQAAQVQEHHIMFIDDDRNANVRHVETELNGPHQGMFDWSIYALNIKGMA